MSDKNNDTIFDKIIRKEIPANIIYEDDIVIAFNDINPQAPTHILVIPKKKTEKFCDLRHLDSVDVGNFIKGVSTVANALNLDDKGYRVVINCGNDAQQTVNYIHAHILAGRKMTWPPG